MDTLLALASTSVTCLDSNRFADLPAMEAFVLATVDGLVNRCIQGSPEILPLLVRRVHTMRTDLVTGIRQVTNEGSAVADIVVAALERESVLALQEKIKIIAQRKCYGLDKKCNVFEDQDDSSARVWELHDAQLFATFDKYNRV